MIMCFFVVAAAAAVTVVEGLVPTAAGISTSSWRRAATFTTFTGRNIITGSVTKSTSATSFPFQKYYWNSRVYPRRSLGSILIAAASTTSATTGLLPKSTASSIGASTTTSTSTTTDATSTVLSSASLLRVITSSRGGVASIRIRDDTTTATTSTSSTSSSSEGVTASSKNNHPSSDHQDALGKRVLFTLTNDDQHDHEKVVEGMIVALRYPVAFVFIPSSTLEGDTPENQLQLLQLLKEQNDTTASVQILHSSAKLKLPATETPLTKKTNTILDCFGNSLVPSTANSTSTSTTTQDVFTPIPKVSEIALINTPLLTGITMVDALTPIGRGQNMLIVGEEGTGRKSVAISAIRTQIAHLNNRGAHCIYACTTTSLAPLQDDEEQSISTTTTIHHNNNINNGVLSRFESWGILNDITFVSITPSSVSAQSETSDEQQHNIDDKIVSAAEAVAVASSACSVADYWARNYGYDTLVVIDTIDPHKVFWDYTTQTLIDIYGDDAVVPSNNIGGGEMRGFFSELIQRAGKYNLSNGGGSITLALIVTIPPDVTSSTNNDNTQYYYHSSDFANQPKIQSRIDALIKQNIKITPQVLMKLGITVPPRCNDGWKRHNALCHVDDLISMTDGQIWLSSFRSKNTEDDNSRKCYQKPLLDVRQSMTRVGIGADTNSRADAPALQPLIGGLRFTLAQAEEEEALESKPLQRQRDALLLAMYTKPNTVRTLAEECICLMAVKFLASGSRIFEEEEKELIMDSLISYVYQHIPTDIIHEINETFELNPVSKEMIQSSIQSFFLSRQKE